MAAISVQENHWQLLDGQEAKWRPLLRAVSLVAEVEVDPEETRPVLAAMGYVYGTYKGHPASDKLRAFRHWPACVALGMTGVAATGYEEGRYWPEVWTAAQYSGSPQDQHVWGKSFLSALTQLGLPTFPGTHHPYLGPILMHCGVPTYCLRDLLQSLADHSRRDPGMDADSYMSWVTELPSRMSGLDKPVQNLLRDGREYAYDIVDRLIDLLDRVRDPKPDLFGVGLPGRLIDETLLLARQKNFVLQAAPRGISRRKKDGKARLALDPFGAGPLVMLPAFDGTWRVSVDGAAHDVPAYPGREGDHGEISFVLPRPARHVQASRLGGTEAPSTFVVVKDEDPLIVFGEDGEFLPASQPLPPSPVWVLTREDRELVKGGDAAVLSIAHVPFGWHGWSLREIDLSDVRELGVSHDCIREVRGTGHPRLLLQQPLAGVTDQHHRPVYAIPPRISLPTGELARTWNIELRQEVSGRGSPPIRMTAYAGEVDPWSELAGPIVGTFEVTILGSLGFRFYRRVCIAQDFSVNYEPAVRLLTSDGLDDAEARISGPAGLSQTCLNFDSSQRETAVMYGELKLLLTPPHLRVLHDDGSDRARWSPKPLRLSTESLLGGDPGALLVRAEALKFPPLRVASGDVIQDVYPAGADRVGNARYQLVQIKDTIAHAGHAELELRIGDRIVPLASIRPPVFATGARLFGAELQLTDCQWTPGLHVGIYQVHAPWRGAMALPVTRGGLVFLPSHVSRAGPIRVFPAMLDGRSSWPHWPDVSDSFLVTMPGTRSSDDHAELQLSEFLAGIAPCPRDVRLEWLWLVAALAERLEADGAREDLRGQCGMCLRADPSKSLVALARTRLEPNQAITVLIGSGIGALRLPYSDVTRHLWTRLPVVATLLAGPALSDPDRASEIIEVVSAEHGQQAATIMCGDADPVFSAMEARERRSLAPDALIDPARVAAEVERGEIARFADREPQLITDAVELLTKTPYGVLAKRIGTREWGALAMSAALALAARAACGDPVLRRDFQRKYQALWSEIAGSFPDLVSLDIIAAQAAVSAIDRAIG